MCTQLSFMLTFGTPNGKNDVAAAPTQKVQEQDRGGEKEEVEEQQQREENKNLDTLTTLRSLRKSI